MGEEIYIEPVVRKASCRFEKTANGEQVAGVGMVNAGIANYLAARNASGVQTPEAMRGRSDEVLQ